MDCWLVKHQGMFNPVGWICDFRVYGLERKPVFVVGFVGFQRKAFFTCCREIKVADRSVRCFHGARQRSAAFGVGATDLVRADRGRAFFGITTSHLSTRFTRDFFPRGFGNHSGDPCIVRSSKRPSGIFASYLAFRPQFCASIFVKRREQAQIRLEVVARARRIEACYPEDRLSRASRPCHVACERRTTGRRRDFSPLGDLVLPDLLQSFRR